MPYGQVRSGKEEEADLTLTLTLTEHLNPNLLLIALTETTMGWDPNLLTLTLTTTLTAKRDLGFVFSPWGFFPSCEGFSDVPYVGDLHMYVIDGVVSPDRSSYTLFNRLGTYSSWRA